ncbi:MAG: tRNA 2-thiouridine(34) synthase MnmA [Candidatus Buchananbacteria bacterium RIFCSPHIGHO2_02_FULL_40_13]|uniref:tRNA-specific 2-thiouridylase MnmA n=1 Tax=Candidatus Buchananbacteria bacterium RIFCSPLOWO2_01_FULL_39_33 TaxID=1797543 RepID=A0A1G1YJW0_9BACT|nr:MAG: tRNA 2-thiouridine(34) synthase MnmA [Candidatus Buchananbacteria bacterium RIFCSPHIGHO2_01_FULL_40_35]OGY50708.1 MAG: tRNA 2-thiouridine(34) synthase MnmA [Candidatus Buchananbacteria bacterium RIFCSPHIGHO2_02_FULL_40_13]OGY52638.1 MAG: tRNA 2-thiouridine(34) synthase MnmA [Candidatus Buchananbacteria bacterium RIFCSPLOWO2_01_FULL_39_33]
MIKKKKIKVVVAMSGGVDSAVAAALLKKQGYEVIGVFMQFWFPTGVIYGENRCCSLESFNLAKETADILGLKIHKLNFGRQFKEKIVDEFLSDYAQFQTPNPCVACNKFIKFDLLLKNVLTVFEADYLATGHYVIVKKTRKQENKKTKIQYNLLKAKDKNKDQSYFLYNLRQDQLKHLLFPLGKYRKEEVRQLAKKFKLPVANRADSQEICFVGHNHYDFLKRYLKLKPGKIVALKKSPSVQGGDEERWEVLGQHQGLPLYTIGQRSGLGLSGGPWYVASLNKNKNLLIVTQDQNKSKIFSKSLKCYKISWVSGEPKFPLKCQAQIRYRGQVEKCLVRKKNNILTVEFSKFQRAIAPGQSVVFYAGDEVLGGGVII